MKSDYPLKGQSVPIEAGRAAIQSRPPAVSKEQVRKAVMFNHDSDMFLLDANTMLIAGLGPSDLEELNPNGIPGHRLKFPALMMSFRDCKQLVEGYHGQYVPVPAKGYTLLHCVEYVSQFDQWMLLTSIEELVSPWYEVTGNEQEYLTQMSLALCRAMKMAPQAIPVEG